jgi:uncharacterized protein (TIGR03083 family)
MANDRLQDVAILRRSQDRLAQTVLGLDAAGIRAPSYASEWSVAQVLSHLGSQAEVFGAFLEAGLTGADAPGTESFPPIWDAWNARSPEEQVRDSIADNDAFITRMEALDAGQRDSFRLAAFGLDIDFPMFLRMRVSEHAVHSWDVIVSVDPSATLPADAVELLVDGLPQLVARVGKPTEAPFTLRVTTTDSEQNFALVITDVVGLEPWSERDVDGVLRLSSEELVRLVYGRLDPAHTPSAKLEAESLGLDDVRAVFPGI